MRIFLFLSQKLVLQRQTVMSQGRACALTERGFKAQGAERGLTEHDDFCFNIRFKVLIL